MFLFFEKQQKKTTTNNTGVGLAILEKAQVISPIVDNDGATTSAGTVSAGYQNFFICLEMLCAAIALRYAFPYQVCYG